ncbi:hypothetical protein AAEX28_07345 [Lentisphaerota bacterium WC36G]|nr:hypothetical protein LJT99_10205 [Lentisphaerae bacterium WC36]
MFHSTIIVLLFLCTISLSGCGRSWEDKFVALISTIAMGLLLFVFSLICTVVSNVFNKNKANNDTENE